MEPELAELVDARAIEQVIVDYFDRIDALDPFGAAGCFTADATADLMTGKVYHGRDQIGRALARIVLQYHRTSHHISNHRAWIDGDTARTNTYVYAFHRFPDDRIWHLWARNTDRLAKADGAWRISERVLVPIDGNPPWELIDPAWYRSHPGRKTHEEVQAELDRAYERLDRHD